MGYNCVGAVLVCGLHKHIHSLHEIQISAIHLTIVFKWSDGGRAGQVGRYLFLALICCLEALSDDATLDKGA